MKRTVLLALFSSLLACGGEASAPATTIVVAPPAPPVTPPPPVRAGPLCTYHGVCWASPFPQGNALHAVRALAADRVVAVGDRGTVLAWNAGAWAFEDTPSRERLLDVAGTADALIAVGEHGTILHRESDAHWSAMTSGTEATLHAAVVLEPDDFLCVGDGALALHWDGSAWTRETLPPEVPVDMSLVALTRHGAAVYALGARRLETTEERIVLARDAGGWRVLSSLDRDAGSLCALADGSLVLSGESARHGDGITWRERAFGSDRPLDAIWSAAADDVWAAGFDGRLAHWDGHAWHRDQLEAELDVDDLDGTAADDLWAVGEHGLIAHRDAAGWTIVSSGPRNHLEGIAGLSADDVWALGDHVSLHYDGHAWSLSGPDDADLEQITASASALWAVGGDGAIRRYASGTWTSEPSGATTKLEGIWAIDDTHAIAVGGSEWSQRDGSAWQPIADRPSATGIWGASPTSAWSVGGGGVARWDGTTWTPVAGTESSAWFGVWGASENDVWAVGSGGHILHFDGTSWSPIESNTTQDLVHVWGRSASDVWAVGLHGTIVHYDGTRWRWRDSGTDELLHSVWGTPGGDTWLVGHGGTVLRVSPP